MEIIQHINGENTALILFFIGVYGLIARRNVIKSIMSLGIMQAAAVLFFISINATKSVQAPIGKVLHENSADPVPQALMITAVVIGVSITALCLTMFITQYHVYGLPTGTGCDAIEKNGDLNGLTHLCISSYFDRTASIYYSI